MWKVTLKMLYAHFSRQHGLKENHTWSNFPNFHTNLTCHVSQHLTSALLMTWTYASAVVVALVLSFMPAYRSLSYIFNATTVGNHWCKLRLWINIIAICNVNIDTRKALPAATPRNRCSDALHPEVPMSTLATCTTVMWNVAHTEMYA